MSYYKHHVFFCLNQRDQGQPCCARQGAQEPFDHLQSPVKALGLKRYGGCRGDKAGGVGRVGYRTFPFAVRPWEFVVYGGARGGRVWRAWPLR